MNKLPFLRQAISGKMRGKQAVITLKPEIFEDPEYGIKYISKKYDDYLKLNKLDKTPVYMGYIKEERRLLERPHPHEFRNQKKRDNLRKTDRAIVNGFCNTFMWSQGAYKPKKK